MCGIAGYMGRGNQEILTRMGEVLAHRGPDDSGTWVDGDVGFAFARLAIIDLSPLGRQPMTNESGTVTVVFNGEIYNYQELREKLLAQGETFKSTSDTEVILKLYEHEGTECFEKLKGMFAIAIYDKEENALFLGRDAMGEKPLYYAELPGTFVFGSEIKALREHPDFSPELDKRALGFYLSQEYVPGPNTIYDGIKKLLPGHVLEFRDGLVSSNAFWKLCVPERRIRDEEALEELDGHLRRAVESQLVADVPVGVFLSGGIDSSTVAYYARQRIGEELNTFSIGFEEKAFDESSEARLVASHLGTRHHEEILSAHEAIKLISEIPEVFDEPVGDASVLPTMLLARFASKHVKVVLGGDGADELLLGYPTFQAEQYAKVWGAVPAGFRAAGTWSAGSLPTSHGYFSFDFKARSFVNGYTHNPYERHLNWLGSFREKELVELLEPEYRKSIEGINSELVDAIRAECPELSGLNALSHFYARTYLVDDVLTKVDRASMHYSLEVRAPFLDRDLVSFLLSLPADLKYRDGKGKWILRKLMQDRLPSSILAKKKRGFAPPVAQWLSGALKPLVLDLLSSERLRAQGIFNAVKVEQLLREHFAQVRDNRKQIWTLLVFQLWHERWMHAN